MYVNNGIDYLRYLKDKVVYIFGAGDRGQVFADKLKAKNIKIGGFIDNNKNLQGTKIANCSVFSVNDFAKINNNESMVVTCSWHCESEMKNQLLEQNIFNVISESEIDLGGEGGEGYYSAGYFEYQKKIGEFGGRIKLDMFLPYIQKDMTVVEFGSGGGFLLDNIGVQEKIGIEVNDLARKCAAELGIKSVKYISDLPDDYADLIISTSVLEHVENPYGALKELRNKLKKNGKAVFHVPNESCDTEYLPNDINNHLYTWNCLNLGNLFKAAGYFVHSVENISSAWPREYYRIEEEVSRELFTELCSLRGKAYEKNSCIIVAYK